MDLPFSGILLQDVLEFLDLESLLLSVMPVCRFWRSEAVRHPLYWREIQASDGRLYSIDMFLLRISRSIGRPIRVRISLDNPCPLLQAVSHHLPHIRILSIIAVVSHATMVLEALRHSSAPLLESLSLNFGFDFSVAIHEQVLASLPSDLLAAHAPALTFASLINIALPPTAEFPRCFSNLTCVTVQIGNPETPVSQRRLPNVFEHCPNLEVLDLKGNIILDHPAFREARLWNSLKALVLDGPLWQSGLPIFQLPIAALPYIWLQHAGTDGIAALAGTLGDSLRLSVEFEHEQNMLLNLRSPISVLLRAMDGPAHGMRRIDVRLPYEPPGLFPHDEITAFQHAPIVGAVVRLEIALDNWGDLVGSGYLAAFPSLDTLVLDLHQRDFNWAPSEAQLGCPALRQLIVRGRFNATGMHVDIADVAAFAIASLHGARLPLALSWEEINVDGAESDCLGVFNLPRKA